MQVRAGAVRGGRGATLRALPVVSRLTMGHDRNPGSAYLNAIGTATPEHDVHAEYLAFARHALGETRDRAMFDRLVARSQIDRRFGVVSFAMYDGAPPDTAARMRAYEALAARRTGGRGARHRTRARAATHLILTTCTGFYAPGIDIGMIARAGLSPGIERTVVGFMGCYAAVTALELARHVVRSDAEKNLPHLTSCFDANRPILPLAFFYAKGVIGPY